MVLKVESIVLNVLQHFVRLEDGSYDGYQLSKKEFNMDEIDFGSGFTGHWVGWHPDRKLNPQYEGIPDSDKAMLLLKCPHGEGGVTIKGEMPGNEEGWTVESWEPLTLSPSIHRTECGCHGFIREGKWVTA